MAAAAAASLTAHLAAGAGHSGATGSGVSGVAQKRKMLWGGRPKEDNSKSTATWTSLSTQLGNAGERDRFLQLMGGKKAGNEADADDEAAAAAAAVDYGGVQHSLEQEFQTALHRSQGNNKHGLG